MRDDDPDDPKRPQPAQLAKKGSNPLEHAEHVPWDHLRSAQDRDRHRNV